MASVVFLLSLLGLGPNIPYFGEEILSKEVTGTFTVKMVPQKDEGNPEGLHRMLLDKHYDGPLYATGRGQMVTGMTAVEGSAAYVAMERVEGELEGLKGGFLLQHSGTMGGGKQTLSITVVPDSGTGALVGLSGQMDIKIKEGSHYYVFTYQLTR